MAISAATKQKFVQALQGLEADAPNFYSKMQRATDRWNLATGQNLSVGLWLIELVKRTAWSDEVAQAQVTAEEQGDAQKEQLMNDAVAAVMDPANSEG